MSSNNFEDLVKWTTEFKNKKGRPLKVLHIGNIAANGYLNAKFQRELGIEADVLCNDYYHIMAYPEWEELPISDQYGQDIKPNFSSKDINNYNRPKWFVQGPLILCFDYLLARNSGNHFKANKYWKNLKLSLSEDFIYKPNYYIKRVLRKEYFIKLLFKIDSKFSKNLNKIKFINKFAKYPRSRLKKYYNVYKKFIAKMLFRDEHAARNEYIAEYVHNLNSQYREHFPNRTYIFNKDGIQQYLDFQNKWLKLFSYYDVVQCYGTDPIYGCLFSDKPYVCFEHGTLRTFTSDHDQLNALTSLAYKKARHVFITNGDCLDHALKLDIENYSPMIHPIDVNQHRQVDTKSVTKLRQNFNSDVLLFCPLRHDWKIKGTEKHIYALKLAIEMIPKTIKMVMTNWGEDLENSKSLAKELGVYDHIIWIPPLSRVKMIEMIHASDVVLDQTILPCFGSTTPQALACGVPAIMSYQPDSTAWLFDTPAPIISASTAEEISQGIQTALDKEWLSQFKILAEEWINHYHSAEVALTTQLKVYKQILEEA